MRERRRAEDAVADAAPRTLTATDGGIWEDLKEAFPLSLPDRNIVFRFIAFACSIIVYLGVPAMRVENGSADACDPVRTYGEISEEGMVQLLDGLGGRERSALGDFLDIGSGHGAYAMWACRHGGFSRCWGVELQRERHEVAETALRESRTNGVSLILGDIQAHPEVFLNLSFAYLNNLCFPSDVAKAVAARFGQSAPLGAELWTLAPLPEPLATGIEKASTNISLFMPWRQDQPYHPFRYRRALPEGPAAEVA